MNLNRQAFLAVTEKKFETMSNEQLVKIAMLQLKTILVTRDQVNVIKAQLQEQIKQQTEVK